MLLALNDPATEITLTRAIIHSDVCISLYDVNSSEDDNVQLDETAKLLNCQTVWWSLAGSNRDLLNANQALSQLS